MRKQFKEKGVNIKVHPNLYSEMQKIRRQFMRKYNLSHLTVVDMTGSPKLKIKMDIK